MPIYHKKFILCCIVLVEEVKVWFDSFTEGLNNGFCREHADLWKRRARNIERVSDRKSK